MKPVVSFVFVLGIQLSVIAHSWVEQLSLASDRRHRHVGFPRGNVHRDSPLFLHNGAVMTYLLPPNERANRSILADDRVCMPRQQRPVQTRGSPRLTVYPGAIVTLRYQENGHVTLLNNTPGKQNSGQVFVYGTDQSSPDDSLLAIHRIWNSTGTGGDQRGRLLIGSNFDDGKCYGPNFGSSIYQERQEQFRPDPGQGPNRWCQTLVKIPCNVRRGLYTLYWIWDWPSLIQGRRQEEIYTTCIDLVIA